MRRWVALASAMYALTGCSFDDTRQHCSPSSKCETGQVCDRGFCVTMEVQTSRNPSMTERDSSPPVRDASPDDPPPSAAMDSGGPTVDASRPPADAGQTMPDDPTPAPCENGSTRSCTLSGTTAERCRVGMQTCESGVFGTCVISEAPRAETCDGIDEDCDGKVDEGIKVDCYPEGMAGCTLAPNTPPECKGMCTLGTRACRDGKLGGCDGAVVPTAESCTTSGATADENCNGQADETCSCMAGETRACYPAPSTTLNVGKCKAGMQSCTNGLLGTCTGAVVPSTETCANEGADDNCNGVSDDVVNRDAPCMVESNKGICRNGTLQCRGNGALTCVTPNPAAAESCNGLDDDCDGKTDEGIDQQTDSMHCGACNTVCGSGEACCAGKCANLQEDESNCGACGASHACLQGSTCCKGTCVDTTQDNAQCGACGTPCMTGETCCGGQCSDTKNDPKHCGGCTTTCSMGTQPGCCDGACVDFLSPQNCGRCGNSCGVLDGGVVCTCGTTQAGTMCMSSVLGVCI